MESGESPPPSSPDWAAGKESLIDYFGPLLASKRARRVQETHPSASSPDWEALPEAALFHILRKASLSGWSSSAPFRVCKRWRAVGKQAQARFIPRDFNQYGGSLLLREMAQFPNLTQVRLFGANLSDTVLESLPGLCPRLIHLKLGQFASGQFEYDAPADDSEDSEATAAGLSRVLAALPGLRSLFFNSESVALPDSVSLLQKLTSLTIEDAWGPLPDSLGALASLKSLSICHVDEDNVTSTADEPMTSVPASVWRLPGLERLSLQLENGLNFLPPDDLNLPSLRHLSLASDTLTTLTASLSRLSSLEELVLRCLLLRTLPDSVYLLPKLRKLSVDGASFRSLPQCLLGASSTGQTLGIQVLSLKSYRHELTGGLRCLSATLRTLSIEHFDHYLPYQIGGLTRLRSLSLCSFYVLEYFPDSLADLTALEELEISFCERLEALPRAMSSCARLRVLRVHTCSVLKRLPDDLGEIPSLRALLLRGLPSLSHLPQSLEHAQGLQQITVEECPRAVLPLGLLRLPRLDEASRRSLREAMQLRIPAHLDGGGQPPPAAT